MPDCEYTEVTQYLYFVVFTSLNFVAWGLIGTVYLVDYKLSTPPGTLISAEAFSYMMNTICSIAYWPPLQR
jgi:hypothetical protein